MPKNYLVTKANDLIQARYKLTLGEIKIILLLASMIQPEDKEFSTYKIKVSDFMDLLGVKNKSTYKQVEKITQDLMTKVFTIKKKNSTLKISWLSSAEYFRGDGMIELCFDPKLKPYFLQLKENFTSYKLTNVIQLKSYYSIRLYELLKQYQKLKERAFDLDELRDILGIEKNKYKQYGSFKQKVLKVAQDELRKSTDIDFDFKEIKKGRKVAGIKFIINHKKKEKEKTKNPLIDEKNTISTAVFNEIKTIIKEPLDQQDIQLLLDAADNDVEKIRQAYEVMNHYRRNNEIEDILGFLFKAIKKNWTTPSIQKALKKGTLCNFEAEDYDFDQLEQLERQYLEQLDQKITDT
jgi:plasmid replication initiation protein